MMFQTISKGPNVMDSPSRPHLHKVQKPKSETVEVTDANTVTKALKLDSITLELGFHNVHKIIMNLRPLPKNLRNPLVTVILKTPL